MALRKNTATYKMLEAYLYLIKQERGLKAAKKIMGKDLKTKPTDTSDRSFNIKLELYKALKDVESNTLGRILRNIKNDLGK